MLGKLESGLLVTFQAEVKGEGGTATLHSDAPRSMNVEGRENLLILYRHLDEALREMNRGGEANFVNSFNGFLQSNGEL